MFDEFRYDEHNLRNLITNRKPGKDIYIANNKKFTYLIRHMHQSDSGTAWMKIDVIVKELSAWVYNFENIDKGILYLSGNFIIDMNFKRYWANLLKNINLIANNVFILDFDMLENHLRK